MTSRVESAERRRAELIEDVEELIAAKEWPERIAHRLNFRASYCLERRLNEIGRRDLSIKMRELDQSSRAFQLAHYTPMDEVVARDKKASKDRKKAAA